MDKDYYENIELFILIFLKKRISSLYTLDGLINDIVKETMQYDSKSLRTAILKMDEYIGSTPFIQINSVGIFRLGILEKQLNNVQSLSENNVAAIEKNTPTIIGINEKWFWRFWVPLSITIIGILSEKYYF